MNDTALEHWTTGSFGRARRQGAAESSGITTRSSLTDRFAHIKGTHHTTVDGGVRVFVNANVLVGSNYTIQVGSNANVNIQVDKGNVNLIATQGNKHEEV